ncbi:MAG: type VI secretion protein IcmF/TssM N-terminal domain-containing protein [Pirellula sp.]
MIRFIESIINAITVPVRQLYHWFCNCLPGIRYLSERSIPWKWAFVSLLIIILIWVVAGIKLWLFTVHKMPMNWFAWILIASPVLIVIPVLVYHFVRIYLTKEESKYPDIDRIWYEGLELAKQNRIEVDQTPLFLFLGTTSVQESNTLMQLSALNPIAISPTASEGPISFYANNEAMFVFLHGCNCISRMRKAPAMSPVSTTDADSGLPDDHGGTIEASYLAKLRPAGMDEPSGTATSTLFGTKDVDHRNVQSSGTLLLDEGQSVADWIHQPNSRSRQLSSTEILDCGARLRHICNRIREARGPICPINGVLTTIPIGLIETSAVSLQSATRADLAILREVLRVRVPNTVLVTGLEQDEGFVELMKRLPPPQLVDKRFGKGADLWCRPDMDRLSAIAAHATAQFEDWIYMLFQSDGALKRKNNSRLFGLLCRIRGGFAENLVSTLQGGFGFSPDTEPELGNEQFLFGGCYFAATGAGPSEQGFARNVVRKLIDQQGELEWAPAAIEEDRRFQFLANLAALVGLIAILAIVAMLLTKFL